MTHLNVLSRVPALAFTADQIPRVRGARRVRATTNRRGGAARGELLPPTSTMRRQAQLALTQPALLALLLADRLPLCARLLRLLALLCRPPTPFRDMRLVLVLPDVFRRLGLGGGVSLRLRL